MRGMSKAGKGEWEEATSRPALPHTMRFCRTWLGSIHLIRCTSDWSIYLSALDDRWIGWLVLLLAERGGVRKVK